jgi:hypothetical protein
VQNDENEDLMDQLKPHKMFSSLKPFLPLLGSIAHELQSSRHKKNFNHYDRTIERLIEGMIEQDQQDVDQVISRDFRPLPNTKLTITDFTRAMLRQGKYKETESKCHSFKSFTSLLKSN